jgi:hypothetical protein
MPRPKAEPTASVSVRVKTELLGRVYRAAGKVQQREGCEVRMTRVVEEALEMWVAQVERE